MVTGKPCNPFVHVWYSMIYKKISVADVPGYIQCGSLYPALKCWNYLHNPKAEVHKAHQPALFLYFRSNSFLFFLMCSFQLRLDTCEIMGFKQRILLPFRNNSVNDWIEWLENQKQAYFSYCRGNQENMLILNKLLTQSKHVEISTSTCMCFSILRTPCPKPNNNSYRAQCWHSPSPKFACWWYFSFSVNCGSITTTDGEVSCKSRKKLHYRRPPCLLARQKVLHAEI